MAVQTLKLQLKPKELPRIMFLAHAPHLKSLELDVWDRDVTDENQRLFSAHASAFAVLGTLACLERLEVTSALGGPTMHGACTVGDQRRGAHTVRDQHRRVADASGAHHRRVRIQAPRRASGRLIAASAPRWEPSDPLPVFSGPPAMPRLVRCRLSWAAPAQAHWLQYHAPALEHLDLHLWEYLAVTFTTEVICAPRGHRCTGARGHRSPCCSPSCVGWNGSGGTATPEATNDRRNWRRRSPAAVCSATCPPST